MSKKLLLAASTVAILAASPALAGDTDLEALRAEIQAMRDASPTGGALGQVAVRELELLQSTIASLDQSQDDDVLKQNLLAVKTHVQNWKKAIDASALEGLNDTSTSQTIDFSELP